MADRIGAEITGTPSGLAGVLAKKENIQSNRPINARIQQLIACHIHRQRNEFADCYVKYELLFVSFGFIEAHEVPFTNYSYSYKVK